LTSRCWARQLAPDGHRLEDDASPAYRRSEGLAGGTSERPCPVRSGRRRQPAQTGTELRACRIGRLVASGRSTAPRRAATARQQSSRRSRHTRTVRSPARGRHRDSPPTRCVLVSFMIVSVSSIRLIPSMTIPCQRAAPWDPHTRPIDEFDLVSRIWRGPPSSYSITAPGAPIVVRFLTDWVEAHDRLWPRPSVWAEGTERPGRPRDRRFYRRYQHGTSDRSSRPSPLPAETAFAGTAVAAACGAGSTSSADPTLSANRKRHLLARKRRPPGPLGITTAVWKDESTAASLSQATDEERGRRDRDLQGHARYRRKASSSLLPGRAPNDFG
jgi:hypothetical protein